MEEVTGWLLAAWASIVGTFLPIVVQLVKKVTDTAGAWSTRAKQILALVIAAVGGVVTTAGTAGWDFAGHAWQEFVVVATGVWAVSQVAYANLWKSIFPKAPRFDEGYNESDPVKDANYRP